MIHGELKRFIFYFMCIWYRTFLLHSWLLRVYVKEEQVGLMTKKKVFYKYFQDFEQYQELELPHSVKISKAFNNFYLKGKEAKERKNRIWRWYSIQGRDLNLFSSELNLSILNLSISIEMWEFFFLLTDKFPFWWIYQGDGSAENTHPMFASISMVIHILPVFMLTLFLCIYH